MKFVKVLDALYLLFSSRRHLLIIMEKSENVPFNNLINQSYEMGHLSDNSINAVVKSYFWASRIIKNCHCLPRSIALYQHLRAMNLDVEHKFGVNKKNKKLAAHAWVEYHGEPLNEPVDLYDRFVVLDQSNFIESLK